MRSLLRLRLPDSGVSSARMAAGVAAVSATTEFMHFEALASNTRRVLTLLSGAASPRGFSLGGGTGLALHMGHRLSVDLDWFTRERFDPMVLRAELPADENTIVTGTAANTLHATVSGVKVDFLRYDYPLLEPPELQDGVSILSVRDIAAMKLSAVTNRGAKKDFYDIAWLLRSHSLPELLGWYETKFQGFDTFAVIRSLTWFEDAKRDPDPVVLQPLEWAEVQKVVAAAVENL